MALKPCRECGQDVSSEAKQCPHCGVEHPANRAAQFGANLTRIGCLLTLVITVPIIFFMCVGLAAG